MAVVVLLGGGGGALFLALRGNGGNPNPGPTASSTVAAPPTSAAPSAPPTLPPTSAPTGNPLERLNSRDTDPQPLTLDELFGKQKFEVDGRTYTRAARQEDENCADAVEGTALRAALRAGDCNQVLRASYISRNGDVVGTVGIINLQDVAAVEEAASASENSSNHIAPLPGSGAAQNLGRGSALGARAVRGHYLVMSWLQYADGHEPSSTKDKKLAQHGDDVFENTVIAALTYRMIMGEPKP